MHNNLHERKEQDGRGVKTRSTTVSQIFNGKKTRQFVGGFMWEKGWRHWENVFSLKRANWNGPAWVGGGTRTEGSMSQATNLQLRRDVKKLAKS